MRNPTVLTIGHSSHSYEYFLSLLRKHEVNAIADVRTTPHSRHFPQFNEPALRAELKADGISYVFLGKELGGRPSGPMLYSHGVADYEKMSRTSTFAAGIQRVMEGATRFRIALMCSEHDPLDCHRCLLVGRELANKGATLLHIIGNGALLHQTSIEEKLLKLSGRANADLLMNTSDRLAAAYRDRSLKVAYMQTDSRPKHQAAKQ